MRQGSWSTLLCGVTVAALMVNKVGFAQDTETGANAETPAAETAPEAAPANAQSESSNDGGGLLMDGLRIGPTASLGFPFLLNYGVDVTWKKTFGFAFAGGKMRRTVSDADIEVYNWDARVRWFPWQGSFFLGAAVGEQGIVGKMTKDLDVKSNGTKLTVPTTVRLELENTYIAPHLGWFATWDMGLTLGFEIGAQILMSTKTKLQSSFENVSSQHEAEVKSSKQYKDAEKDVTDTAEMFGKQTIPYVNLLRIGWLF